MIGFVAIILALTLGVLGFLFWLSLKQMNAVMNFFFITLLSEENYRKHSENLKVLASDVPAENAPELFLKVEHIVRNLILKGDRQKMSVAAIGLLWEAKQARAKA